ncbi:uncharacterized protein ACRADG_002301 [Cochliomyia hominivorax]
MDRLRLIEEIRKRPPLWDFQNTESKSRIFVPDLWREVAENMGPDVTVEDCKRKWKNLRDAYRAEIKRIEYRIEKDLLKGVYDPKYDYGSKWAYFKAMRFIKDIRRPRRSNLNKDTNNVTNQNAYALWDENAHALSDDNVNSYSNDNDNMNNSLSYDQFNDDNDSVQFHQFDTTDNIKVEPEFETDMEIHSVSDDDVVNNDDDNTNEMYGEQLFKEAEKLQQQAERENNRQSSPNQTFYRSNENSFGNDKPINDNNASFSSSGRCKCSNKRSFDQVHFLEDLKKEEQNLIKSTRLDITRSDNLAHVGDSDYNFLVSFLPQMKKMSELQNLQFRAKMTEVMLNIMIPSTSVEAKSSVTSSQVASDSCLNKYYSLVLREPSRVMDRYRLIAEIRKRPALWDAQSMERSRLKIADLWREVASNVGGDVTPEACKCKWKHLRDAYRTEMKRAQHRIERDFRKGKFDPTKDYGSKWQYYEHMKFVDIGSKARNRGYKSNDNDSDHGSNFNTTSSCNTKTDSQLKDTYMSSPPPLRKFNTVKLNALTSSSSMAYNRPPKATYYQINFLENTDREEDEEEEEMPIRSSSCHREMGSDGNSCANDKEIIEQYPISENLDNISIKMEPNIDIEPDSYNPNNTDNDESPSPPPPPSNNKSYHKDDNTPILNKRPKLMQKSCIPYQKLKESNSSSHSSFCPENVKNHNCPAPAPENNTSNNTYSRSSIDFGDADTSFLISFSKHMKSMNQLQNLKFRAQMSELILNILSSSLNSNAATSQEYCSNRKSFMDIADSDCNFLTSFLPHLKSMTQLQNLQLRAKMSDLILNILSPTLTANNTQSDSTTTDGTVSNLV